MLHALYPRICRLFTHISGKRRLQLFALLILMILSSALEVISIGAIIPFLGALTNQDKVFDSSSLRPVLEILGITSSDSLVTVFTILFCFAAITAAIVRLATLWIQARVSFGLGLDLNSSIFNRTLHQPLSVHLARNSSEIIMALSATSHETVQFIVMPLLSMINAVLMALAIMFFLFWLSDPLLTAVAAGTLIISYGILIHLTKSSISKNGSRITEQSINAIKAVQESLGGIRDVILGGTQSVFSAIYINANSHVVRSQANILILSNFPRFLLDPLGLIMIASASVYLFRDNDSVSSWLPPLGALALGAQRLLPLLQQIFSSLSSIRAGQSSLSRTLGLLEQPTPTRHLHDGESIPTLKQSIFLNHVSFYYPNNTNTVLNDVCIEITAGSKVGIIGDTGSGKSTLTDIMMGLLTPTSGDIRIDGIKLTDFNLRSWQSQIAHVPQNIFLTDNSILENIAFGVPINQINVDRVWHAVNLSQLRNTIEQLENGLMTTVGERGVRLSGGQQQRIGIARALYQSASIIFFDEATSALDQDTENALINAINSLDRKVTLIMIAHRWSTLRDCSMIFEIKNGKIQRCLTYNKLME
jgi:ABC-type bacteriocin/lantibiotic exporter with double-glycine peptidase domain